MARAGRDHQEREGTMNLLKKIWHWFRPELEIIDFQIPDLRFKFRGAKNRWTQYACYVSWWQKGKVGKKEKMADVAVWKDGKKAYHIMLDEQGNEWVHKETWDKYGRTFSGYRERRGHARKSS